MINLEVVTPEKKVVDLKVDSVTVPTAKGQIGILPRHAPLISTLRPGMLTYSHEGKNDSMVVAGGFIEVNDDTVSILADIVESKAEIDLESARSEREQAEKVLGSWNGTEAEFEIERERLEKAQARLALGGGK